MHDHTPPTRRADCLAGGCNELRPCPWVRCRYHLWHVQTSWRTHQRAPWEMDDTCALDIADEGGASLERIGAALGYSRARAEQLEKEAIVAILTGPDARALSEYAEA